MKYIVVFDDESARYKYNLWKTHQYDDRTVSEDVRIICTDDETKFLKELTQVFQGTRELIEE